MGPLEVFALWTVGGLDWPWNLCVWIGLDWSCGLDVKAGVTQGGGWIIQYPAGCTWWVVVGSLGMAGWSGGWEEMFYFGTG